MVRTEYEFQIRQLVFWTLGNAKITLTNNLQSTFKLFQLTSHVYTTITESTTQVTLTEPSLALERPERRILQNFRD